MSRFVNQIYPADAAELKKVDALLSGEGIRRDANLDYICGLYDDSFELVATGSCFGSTLRCLAVRREYRGEGLLNEIVAHLLHVQMERGNSHIFLYTKNQTAMFFRELGFYEIARVDGALTFMENKRDGFQSYLRDLEKSRKEDGISAAVVMNANPFTNGHLYLTETAAGNCDTLHLFVVSEESGAIPFSVRKRLVEEGVKHLSNVIIHDTKDYLISSATFPSYFLKDSEEAIRGQASLDTRLFAEIARALRITIRFAGDEPTSLVTGLYNEIMARDLPGYGIECRIIPRLKEGSVPISASTVRRCLRENNFERLKTMVPPSTYAFFQSDEARPILDRLREMENVIHY